MFEVAASSKEILGIPTIVLAEVACGYTASERVKFLEKIQKSKNIFKILDFDQKCAMENALLHDEVNNKQIARWDAKQKVKTDIQIVAIAVANGARQFITDDQGMHNFINCLGEVPLTVLKTCDITLISSQRQIDWINEGFNNN